jgi:PadR family transcriptional regulator PadR
MQPKPENIDAQMRKGVLELCVLALMADEELYPSDILNLLKKSKLIVVEGTLYPLLTRLKNEGLLNYRWVESQSGPPRKYYKLTPEGRTFLTSLKKSWAELSDAVNHVIRKGNS